MIKPSAGFILVKPEQENKTSTSSGIILTAQINDTNITKARVVSVGGTVYQQGSTINPPAKSGDIVIFNKFNSSEYKDGEIKYLFIPFSGVLGVENESKS